MTIRGWTTPSAVASRFAIATRIAAHATRTSGTGSSGLRRSIAVAGCIGRQRCRETVDSRLGRGGARYYSVAHRGEDAWRTR